MFVVFIFQPWFEVWKWQHDFFDKNIDNGSLILIGCLHLMTVWSSLFIGLFQPANFSILFSLQNAPKMYHPTPKTLYYLALYCQDVWCKNLKEELCPSFIWTLKDSTKKIDSQIRVTVLSIWIQKLLWDASFNIKFSSLVFFIPGSRAL